MTEEKKKGSEEVETSVRKRKRLTLSQLRQAKTQRNRNYLKHKLCLVEGRWPTDRYEIAEQGMLEILKAEGATFQNPISRPQLRSAARKCIGDTGLLDHLLKHIDGKVAPGGTERFRRWFNTNGIMEYWLENADLLNIRQQAGVQDPYWIPTNDTPNHELNLLKSEFNNIKRDMQDLLSNKQQHSHQAAEMMKWKAETEHNLKLILASWKSMQDMYAELMAWKGKVEQQVAEIRSVLSSMQEQPPASSPQASERWEDWLESTKLDDFQENEAIPWFDGTNLVNVEQEVPMHDLYSFMPLHTDCPAQDTTEVDILNEQLTKTNSTYRGVGVTKEVAAKSVNVTPDSSTTVNSMVEFPNLPSLCQEMFVELFNWKAKMEQKVTEISNYVNLVRK